VQDATGRFSTRAEHYLKARPGYPSAILEALREASMLLDHSVIADIGSGTGLLSELFLRAGHDVMAVEPNAAMRRAGEQRLAARVGFHSIDGRAEATTLPDASVDLVTVGTAFHWFDRDAAQKEFRRILRPNGHLMVAWNQRDQSSAFMRDYERLVERYASDYRAARHRDIEEQALIASFAPGWITRSFAHAQAFDFDNLADRLLSSSYAPQAGHADHVPMLSALKTLFDAYARDGHVPFEYLALIYAGQMTG